MMVFVKNARKVVFNVLTQKNVKNAIFMMIIISSKKMVDVIKKMNKLMITNQLNKQANLKNVVA
jgi:hypothetical protein